MKSVLLTFYAALPQGCVAMGTDASKLDTVSVSIADPDGWNEQLDIAFRDYVSQATSPTALMEVMRTLTLNLTLSLSLSLTLNPNPNPKPQACLLLEHYLDKKQWLLEPYHRLSGALPSPHFALRCATYSAVALRVFSLDRAFLYDKVCA